MEEKTFGKFLAEKRKERGLTQKALADMLFVTESTVCKWEKDASHPDISLLGKISEILGVSEHELITASVDEKRRENDRKAHKWTNLTLTYNFFFYIAYGITLLTCFIVNLAVNKKLSWFFTVFFSLFLSASFTTFPQYIKKFRLVLITLIQLFALSALLFICDLFYGNGWFLLAEIPIVLFYIIVFLPIILSVYHLPEFFKRHTAIICVLTDFILTVLMLFYINFYVKGDWFLNIALPITAVGFLLPVGITLFIRYLKTNAFIKTGFSLTLSCAWSFLIAITVESVLSGRVLVEYNPFKANFTIWENPYINYNVDALISLTMFILSVAFFVVGIIVKKRSHSKPD